MPWPETGAAHYHAQLGLGGRVIIRDYFHGIPPEQNCSYTGFLPYRIPPQQDPSHGIKCELKILT